MTSPEIEAGLSSYPPALLVGGSRNRMRPRLPAGGGASPLPAGAAQELVGDGTGTALAPLPDDAYPPGAVELDDARLLTVDAGTPGTYSPAVAAGQRPKNVTELQERAHPNGRAPWDTGQYVPVGTSGKRAHWTGDRWAGGESPGYAPADTQFPGDGNDSPEDLTR